MATRAPLEQRFWPKVDKRDPDECWPWRGYLERAGYGVLSSSRAGGRPRRNIRAHRLAWVLANGRDIPLGMVVCHACDNPPCCNPAHLWVGTIGDNNRDMCAKKRSAKQRVTHCPKGHPYSEENTYRLRGLYRRCRICVRVATEAWRQRKLRERSAA